MPAGRTDLGVWRAFCIKNPPGFGTSNEGAARTSRVTSWVCSVRPRRVSTAVAERRRHNLAALVRVAHSLTQAHGGN